MMTQINKRLLRKHFDQSADTYDQYANVQKDMARRLLDMEVADLHLADAASEPANVLELGCGTGRMTETLTRRFASARILAVDISPAMIVKAQTRTANRKVSFVCADIEELDVPGTWDLIVSNAAFQWLNDLPRTLRRLYGHLNPGASLLYSTFADQTFKELRSAFKEAQRQLEPRQETTWGLSFQTPAEHGAMVADALADDIPFAYTCVDYQVIEHFSSVRDFLLSIKRIGANNSNTSQSPLQPAVLRKMMETYDAMFQVQGAVPATYHPMLIRITRNNC